MMLISTLILLIVQSIGTIISIVNKEKLEKVSKWDISSIVFSILALICSLIIFFINEDKEEIRQKIESAYRDSLDIKLKQRDEIHQIQDSTQSVFFAQRLDSSYEKSIKASNEALAKYNLILLDSLTTVTQKINLKGLKDAQFIIKPAAVGETSPVYFTTEGNTQSLRIKFQSYNNTCYNIELRYLFLTYEQKNTQFIYSTIDTGDVFFAKNFLTENIVSTGIIDIDNKYLTLKNVIVLFVGKFSLDPENKNVRFFNEGLFCDFSNKSTLYTSTKLVNEILEKLRKRKLIK